MDRGTLSSSRAAQSGRDRGDSRRPWLEITGGSRTPSVRERERRQSRVEVGVASIPEQEMTSRLSMQPGGSRYLSSTPSLPPSAAHSFMCFSFHVLVFAAPVWRSCAAGGSRAALLLGSSLLSQRQEITRFLLTNILQPFHFKSNQSLSNCICGDSC